MSKCQLCSATHFIHNIDFGAQPVSHRFSNEEHPDLYRHNLTLGQCEKCGLVQITNPFPVKELVPRFSWLTCTEPEGHLDRLVNTISKLPGIHKNSRILGLTFKEDSTLKRFNHLGFNNTYRFDLKNDFDANVDLANVETAVDLFDYDFAKKYVEINGKADIFICRHVIEHSINVANFIAAIKELTHNKSYVVIEIPECGSAFELYDYTTVWEEHNIYFTPILFKNFMTNSGFEITQYIQEPYPLEDASIVIAQKMDAPQKISFSDSNYEHFVAQFTHKKIETRKQLEQFKKLGKVALFGAGHMSVAFINLMDIHDLIDFVLDDNPNKTGYNLPGTSIKICPSSLLYKENISHCLMSLAPESELIVTQKNNHYIEAGGKFLSIFCKNPKYFLR